MKTIGGRSPYAMAKEKYAPVTVSVHAFDNPKDALRIYALAEYREFLRDCCRCPEDQLDAEVEKYRAYVEEKSPGGGDGVAT